MVSRVYEKGRLVYYGGKGDSPGYWANHWENRSVPGWTDRARKGILAEYYGDIFTNWLPRAGKILEAGCGKGQVVMALRARGYEVEGIDFSAKTVEYVKSAVPEAPIRVGDVRKLDYPDAHFSAYISLGVVEHFSEGPKEALAEAARALRPNGIIIISVPRLNPLRRLKAACGFYSGKTNGDFYQYAFTSKEFTALLEQAGFEILEVRCYSVPKGLSDEIPFFDFLQSRKKISPAMHRKLNRSRIASRLFSHMMLFVGRKRESR
jgi:SAM-dependent methyltransferase